MRSPKKLPRKKPPARKQNNLNFHFDYPNQQLWLSAQGAFTVTVVAVAAITLLLLFKLAI